MNRRDWAAFNARHQAEFVFGELIPEAEREHGLPRQGTCVRVVFLIYIEGYSPFRPLRQQLKLEAKGSNYSREADRDQKIRQENHGFGNDVISALINGADIKEVRLKLQREQAWPCYGVAVDRDDLVRELESRYKWGQAETDYYHETLPGGILIHCRVLPREWSRAR